VTVAELVRALERFPPDARVVVSAGGVQVPEVAVGVASLGRGGEPVVVVADRARFAGRLPDMLLER
jgi:hypothetical protein